MVTTIDELETRAPGKRVPDTVAVVTGGGRWHPWAHGSGYATSVLLAREGARVAVVDVNREAAERTVADIQQNGDEAVAVIADLGAEEGCRQAASEIVSHFGKVDILVNNLGDIPKTPEMTGDVDEVEFDRVMAVNIKSGMWMTKHLLDVMPRGSSIVFFSSVAAAKPGGGVAYSVAKAGVESLTRDIAVDYGSRGIRANCVQGGEVFGAMTAKTMPDEIVEERRRVRAQRNVLKVEGTVWDLAYCALFLASPESRYMTGQVIVVDGGAAIDRPSEARQRRAGGWTDAVAANTPAAARGG